MIKYFNYSIVILANIMQVPATITLNNGHSSTHRHQPTYFPDNAAFPMEMPEKLTGNYFILYE